MGKRPGSTLKLPSEHVQRRKRELKKVQAARKEALNLLPLLLAAAAQAETEYDVVPDEPYVVSTVSERRYWLHTQRLRSAQDSWLLDYSEADPELSLDWKTLIENASIEVEDEP